MPFTWYTNREPMGAVVTGDIIASSDLTTRALDAVMDQMAERFQTERFTRYRGDGFQLVTFDVDRGAALAEKVRQVFGFRGIAVRVAWSVGSVVLREGHDLNHASGTAFTAAGRALEEMEDQCDTA